MPAKLNQFQQTMLKWNDLHSYNAVHVVRIPESFDAGRLSSIINATIEGNGLTNLCLDRKRGILRYHGGPMNCEIKVLSGDADPEAVLCAEIETQLNTGFMLGERMNPFRFFVAVNVGSFLLGLVYFHPVADAESIVRMLMPIVNTYVGRAERRSTELAELHPRCHDRLFRQNPVVLARKLAALPSVIGAMRTSSRPRCSDAQDLRNGFTRFSLRSEDLLVLKAASRTLGVTINDLFLALLMKALAPLAARREQAARRRNISIGTIVNTREDLGLGAPPFFGLCLGFFVVTHPVPDGMTVADLARDIGIQTLGIKRRQLYLGWPLELAAARFALRFFSTRGQKDFFRKSYPLWGGITNMNLNSIWNELDGGVPPDYFRAVSTGPITPLVLSITTVGSSVNIGVTYRVTSFRAAEIGAVRQRLLDGLRLLEAGL